MRNIFTLLALLVFGTILSKNHAQTYSIYPTPQKVVETGEAIELTQQINVICESGIGEVTRNRMKEVLEEAGYTIAFSTNPSQTNTNLYIGINGSDGAADRYAVENNLPLAVFDTGDNKFDPYLLQINDLHPHGDIVVLGNDKGSEFYAFATLEQILEQTGGNSIRQITFEDYSHTQYRGIVEGFYGHPYSVENRISLFEFCKRFKMNVFVYGPKSDPYHLGNWRDDYPTSLTEQQRFFGMITQDDLKTLAQKAKACNVDFIWAAHPGLEQGISFANESYMAPGIDALMKKFDHLYSLGIRGFGVFIDDMTYTPGGEMQAHLANQVQLKIRERYATDNIDDKIAPLFFVPTAYALNYGASYTLRYLANVDSEVVIAFTGYDCFSNIRPSAIDDMAGRVNRNPVMWWNNPVNDDHDDRIYMRELTTHWTIETSGAINTLKGLILNPMCQAQASKIALFGAADYSWNPNTFDSKKNWEASFARIVKNGDTQTAEALKCFARFSNTLVEDEEMITLYDNFMEKFGGESFPSEYTQLREELDNLKQACTYIETLKDSPYRDYKLMYEDVRCWNAKLKSISTIALDALDMLDHGNTMSRPEGWEKYLRLNELYAMLETDSAYLVSALEGYGTTTRETFYKVKPADSHLKPFTDFLAGKISSGIPGLWPAKDNVQLITNIENLQGIDLSVQNETIQLNGLSGLDLDKGEYVGIYLGNLEKISAEKISTGKAPRIELSENGKQWTPAELPIREQKAAYIRIKNISEETETIDFDRFSVSRIFTPIETRAQVSTNMPAYQDYTISNVIDGSASTYFWKDGGQAANDYILLTYPTAQPVYQISITFTPNDQPSGMAAIEISTDNKNWQTVTEFTSSQLDASHTLTCDANGAVAKYVRFVIRYITSEYWLQVAEFNAEMSEKYTQTTDQNGDKIASLSDLSLTTNYQAGEAGYIEHRFIENLTIESVEVYHNTIFDPAHKRPSIYVNNGSEWIETGSLESLCTIIDTHEIDTVTAVKIEWNKENIPNLYEILPVGTPYVEKPGKPTAINNVKKDGLTIYTNDNRLIVQSDDMIQNIILFDLNGKTINHFNVNKCIFETTFGSNIPQILIVQVMHTNGNLSTCKIIR